MGRLAHGLPPPHGRRGVAADVPACLAQRLQRSRLDDHEQRRLCGRRDTKRSDWRGGRAAATTSLHQVFSGPAPGMAGDRGGDLAGAAPSGAQRSDLQAGQFAKRASFTRSVKETGPAIPGHGEGPQRVSAGSARLAVLRQGWKPVRGETPVPRWLDAQSDSPARAAGRRQAHRDLADHGPHANGTDPESACPGSAQSTRQVLHQAPADELRHSHHTATRGCQCEPAWHNLPISANNHPTP